MADTTATYIVHYMIACTLLVLAPFLRSAWWLVTIYVAEFILHLCLAYIVQHSDTALVHYLHRDSAKARLVAIWALGAANVARWGLAAKLMFGWNSPTFWAFTAAGAVVNVPYFMYALYSTIRGRFEPRLKVLLRAMFISLLVLAFAFFYAYYKRNVAHFHQRTDPRLLYAGITQLVYSLFLYPLSSYLPEWLLGFLTLPLWMVLWVCAGHSKVLHD